jgi:hypothetical protein
MQVITLERSKTTNLVWLAAAMLGAIMVLTAKQTDPTISAAGVLLAIASLLPFYLWLLGYSHGLPIWPVFALVNGITFALPMVQAPSTLDGYTPIEIIIGGVTMLGFILLGTITWVSMTASSPSAPKTVLMIEREHSLRYLFLFVGAGVVFLINNFVGFLVLPGNLMQVARGVALSLNAMGLFVLAYYHGRGLLDSGQVVWLTVGVLVTVALSLTSLMLAQAIVPVALTIFGYVLGGNKLPWRVLLGVFIGVALLHPGKYEMRDKYWGPSASGGLTLANLPSFYGEWFGHGFEQVGGLAGVIDGPKGDEGASSAFERAGNIQMLLIVQKKSPGEVPFLNGITYEPIPRLLIPRFIDDQKGISHAGNVMLTVNYGLQTLEQTASTSIGWGLIPEAYANFGYLGVAGLAVVLAAFYAFMTRLTVGVPMTSLRFVLGLIVMAASTKADTMGIFVTTQFQGAVGVTMAALLLMRRQPNPLAYVQRATAGARPEATFGDPKLRGEVEASPVFELFAPAMSSPLPSHASMAVGPGSLPKWASRRQRAELAASKTASDSNPAEQENSRRSTRMRGRQRPSPRG